MHSVHVPCMHCACGAQAQEGEAGEAAALQLVAGLREQGVLRAFGGARQVPKRQYTLEDLRLNRIEPARFLSPTDNTLTTVRTVLQARPPPQVSTFLPMEQQHFPAHETVPLREAAFGGLCACVPLRLPQHAMGYCALAAAIHSMHGLNGCVCAPRCQGGVLAALTAAFFALHWELSQLLTALAALGFLVTYDQVRHWQGDRPRVFF